MKILVTGATGYLGNHVARTFRSASHEVAAMVRTAAGRAEFEAEGIEVRPGDLERQESWPAVLEGVDALVHCASLVASWSRDPAAFHRVNVEATVALVEAARASGIRRIVVTGSLFALGPSGPDECLDEHAVESPPAPLLSANEYVRTKAVAARRLRDLQRRGHPVMVVHPTILLGPGKRTEGNHVAGVLADMLAGRFPGLVGNGEQSWNLVPVEDAARGHLLAVERGRPGESYILGGENWTQRRLVERAATHLGVKAPLRRLGRAFPLAVAGTAEGWARLTGRSPFLTRGEVRLYDASWAFTSAKAAEELGYAPGDVDAALARTAAWIRAGGSERG